MKAKANAKGGNHATRATRGVGPGVTAEKDDADELDELEDEDEEDEEEDEAEEDGADEESLERLTKRLRAAAGEVRIAVYRRFPGRDQAFVASIRLDAKDALDYQEHVVARFGGSQSERGGTYYLIFKVGNKYQGTAEFGAEGEPIVARRDGTPEPRPSVATIQQSLDGGQGAPLTADAVARLIAEQLGAYESRKKQAEQEAEIARLRAELEKPRREPAAAKDPTVLELLNAIGQQADRQVTKIRSAEDPELVALKARMDAAEKENQALKESLRAAEKKALEAKLDGIQSAVTAELRALKRDHEKDASKSPMVMALAPIAEMAVVNKVLGNLEEQAADEPEGLLATFLAAMRAPLEQGAIRMAEEALAQINKKPQPLPPPNPKAKPQPKVDAERWAGWVGALLNDVTLATNVDFVAQGLTEFHPYMIRIMQVGDREQMAAFLSETMGAPAVAHIRALSPDDWSAVLRVVQTLRDTIKSMAEAKPETPPPASSATPPASAPPPPKTQTDASTGEAGKTVSPGPVPGPTPAPASPPPVAEPMPEGEDAEDEDDVEGSAEG